MKYYVTIVVFAMMAQVSVGETPARYNRSFNLIENTETSLKRVWEMIKESEGMVKDLFKVLPKSDAYEAAKENLRGYLGDLYYYSITQANCLVKVVGMAEEFIYLIDVEEEEGAYNKDDEEIDEDESEDSDSEEENEKEVTADVEDTTVDNEQTEKDVATRVEPDDAENEDEVGEVNEEEQGEGQDEDNEDDDEENNKENNKENDEEDDEEEEEEDPASYQARLHVAKLLKERSTDEFVVEFRKLLESLQNMPTYIDEEMRSAEFKYSMRLFQLATKTC